ncbi:hypothetical protein NGRA_0346 [Nosema granulosis]|uniref:Uncharacterized protein n=1 Tax=Nosema granulosis TaxID=83296 RepID=A0A9P6L0M2_9MICR|nr:hypothetical protein NGRA_0346 [Nosema granulosis]
MEDNGKQNNEKKERRVSFAAEVETVFEYEEQRHETTISTDEEFTADLTYENSKQLSILNETTMKEFFKKDIKELAGTLERAVNKDKNLETEDKNLETEDKNLETEDKNLETEDKNLETEDKNLETEDKNLENVNVDKNEIVVDVNNLSNIENITEENPNFSKLISTPLKNSPKTKRSKRTSFSPFKRNKNKNVLVDVEQENEINSVESSMISNNSVEATEIINTQKLKFMIPQKKKVKSNITELFAMKGIMFLDTISFGKIRRDTLSKTRKPVDPEKILFYENFLIHRIKFFDDFVEELKAKSEEYERSIENFVNENEEICEMIAGDGINKNTKGMMLHARNLAKIEWYELRSKKELAFNEKIIQNKSQLQNKHSELKAKHEGILEKLKNTRAKSAEIRERIKTIKEQDEKNQADKKGIETKKKDIENYESLVENLNKTLEDLKIQLNKSLLHKQIQENHVKDLKEQISTLLANMRDVCVNEDQLNHKKAEYDKLCAIFDMSIVKIKKGYLEVTFQGYKLEVDLNSESCKVEYFGSGSICGQFMVEILKSQEKIEKIDKFLFAAFRKIYVLNEFLKELRNISLSNEIEIVLKEKDLSVSLESKNFKACKTVHLQLDINQKLQCMISKDGETYLYNLFADKGFLLNHLEI